MDALSADGMDGAIVRALNGKGLPKQTKRVEKRPGGTE
jgi:hypothetical protein